MLAGLLFCLALKPVVDIIEEQVPTLSLNAWYCDDGNLHGTKNELATVVDIIQQEGRRRGLILSTSATRSSPQNNRKAVCGAQWTESTILTWIPCSAACPK